MVVYTVDISKKIKKIKIVIVLSFIVIELLLMIFFPKEFNKTGITPLGVFMVILLFVWISANIYSNFALSPYEKTGKINFEKEMIRINEISIMLKDVKYLKIIYKDIYGESISAGSWAISFGGENEFYMLTKSGDKFIKNILFEKRSQVVMLERHLQYYYNKGINVEFYRFNRLIFPKKTKLDNV